MAMAASISLPLTSPCRRSLASIKPFRGSIRAEIFKSGSALRNPRFHISASSMSIDAPQKILQDSFLDRKESGFLHFAKYHGLGNDFILVDNRDSLEPRVTPVQAVKLCDRNFGIGADGVIFAMPGINGTDYSMRIFNSDGSEPELSMLIAHQADESDTLFLPISKLLLSRCVAMVYDASPDLLLSLIIYEGNKGTLKIIPGFTVHTGAGLIVPQIQDDGKVRVDMGQPILRAPDVPTKLPGNKDQAVIKSELQVNGLTWNVTCVSMGNPHCITFGAKQSEILQVDDLNLSEIGPKFEHHDMFPARTNTEFVQAFSRSHLKMRVWERGAGATLACGTGACAVVVAAVLEGRAERSCTVDLPGGPLEIEWKEEDNHVYMTGPAEVVFYGSVPL
ncbi:hypothetical protein HHK36_016459 [Tetracentron sinense]|uniref:Diaminopimelate epimerase n=1 Tax=Tetracentron sinense TaxID=13715 RepID=A0A834Z2S9_TETSI|nr:hypothetical protein HHK36_016459 [Tetracentron sinense]